MIITLTKMYFNFFFFLFLHSYNSYVILVPINTLPYCFIYSSFILTKVSITISLSFSYLGTLNNLGGLSLLISNSSFRYASLSKINF